MHSLLNTRVLHVCGGDVLVGGSGEERHVFCSRCGAFTFEGQHLPSGTSRKANRAAWDRGELSSPPEREREAHPAECVVQAALKRARETPCT